MLLRALIAIQLSAFITDEHGLCHSLQERCGIIRRYLVTPATPPHGQKNSTYGRELPAQERRNTRTRFGQSNTIQAHYENYVRATRHNIGAFRELGSDNPIQHRGITRTGFGQPDTPQGHYETQVRTARHNIGALRKLGSGDTTKCMGNTRTTFARYITTKAHNENLVQVTKRNYLTQAQYDNYNYDQQYNVNGMLVIRGHLGKSTRMINFCVFIIK